MLRSADCNLKASELERLATYPEAPEYRAAGQIQNWKIDSLDLRCGVFHSESPPAIAAANGPGLAVEFGSASPNRRNVHAEILVDYAFSRVRGKAASGT